MNKKLELLTKGTDIKIVSTSSCKYCGEEFALFDIEKEIYDKHGFKYQEICSTCNFKLLNSFLNDKNLYSRKDSESGKNIISIYSSDFSGDVIEANEYKKLILNDYGLTFFEDIGEDVFIDFSKLYHKFPKASRLIYPDLENGDYSSHSGWAKNVYMSYCVFIDCEDVYFSFRVINNCKNIFSSYNITNSSNIYNTVNVGSCYNISFGNNMFSCSDLLFCHSMYNCKNCIFSCGQINKSYLIFNKQYSKEEYLKIKQDILSRLKDYKQFLFLKSKYENFLNDNLVVNSIDTSRCEKTVSENTFDSYNAVNCFTTQGLKNSINVKNAGDNGDDYMVNIINSIESGTNCENCVGSCSFGMDVFNLFFSFGISTSVKNIYYSWDIESSEECMFCIGLKSKKYCILNKQYEKEDYFKKKEEIISKLKSEGKWGKSLPWDMSVFPYNDTLAYDYYKVNKIIYPDLSEEIIDKNAKGVVTIFSDDFISEAELDLGGKEKIRIKWRTKTKEVNIPENMGTIKAKDLPDIDDIEENGDFFLGCQRENPNEDGLNKSNILNTAIICEASGRPFRIIKSELDFLKKKGLPLPRIHHELRIEKLLGQRPIGEMHVGFCDKCEKEMLSVFKTKPKYKVYCPDCYKEYMYK